jgi:SAM-dependent methyltransferase
LSEYRAAEFTGERVIPELVDVDLLNEHLARYRFTGHFIGALNRPANILDAGCGSGYGAAELSGTGASVTGTDISAVAIDHARLRYGTPTVRFLQSACEALPFPAAAFDVVVAFEVIEHLDRWRELLSEANRVLKSSGVFLVSTPNRDYYAESRGSAGPNPFHRHEFSYEEFREALTAVFPHMHIWTQNHAQAIVFSPPTPSSAAATIAGPNDPAVAHFYLAVCSQSPVPAELTTSAFAWVPSSGNLLRERERHIAKLNGELEKKDVWLRETLDAHSELQRDHETLLAELERQNNWAAELDRELAARHARIGELQKEAETRLSWIRDLESQIETARIEILRLDAESVEVRRKSRAHIDNLEATVAERTAWAQQLEMEIASWREELRRIEASPWFRTGAKLGLGPRPR